MIGKINKLRLSRHKLSNGLHSILLLGAMVSLLSALGWMFAGPAGIYWAVFIGFALFVISPTLSPRLIMRLYAAKPLSPARAPALYSALKRLALHAQLPRLPVLYRVPSRVANAFATGNPINAGIAFTDGLLNSLNVRELNAVMAHEISHLKNNDLWILNISNILGRATSFFSLVGQLLLVLNLPMMVVYGRHIPWGAVLLLIMAPTINVFLQLALSRAREFNADMGAVELTGDPRGLASALIKIERVNAGLKSGVVFPGYGKVPSSMKRTHPDTVERVRRLLDLSPEHAAISSRTPIADQHHPVSGVGIPVYRLPLVRNCGTRC